MRPSAGRDLSSSRETRHYHRAVLAHRGLTGDSEPPSVDFAGPHYTQGRYDRCANHAVAIGRTRPVSSPLTARRFPSPLTFAVPIRDDHFGRSAPP